MSNSIFCDGITLKLDNIFSESESIKQALYEHGIPYDIEESKIVIENQMDYFILEDEFINNSKRLLSIIDKLNHKNYKNRLLVYRNSDFVAITATADDRDKYNSVVNENIIDGHIRNFDISINVLNEALDKNNLKSELIIDFFILLALANRIKYDAENINVEFKSEKGCYTLSLNINSKPLNLYELYHWIFNSDEYKIKIQIARQVIININNLTEINKILLDCKRIYRRIIEKNTNEYFEQINIFKNDFIDVRRRSIDALRRVNYSFLACIGSFSIKIFDNTNHLKFFLTNSLQGVIISVIYLIVLCIIFGLYHSEIESLKETFKGIKRIYEDKVIFENISNDKEKECIFAIEPKLGKLQLIIFVICLIIILLRIGLYIILN